MNEQYLLSKNWRKINKDNWDEWLFEGMTDKNGGYTLKEALKKQEAFDIIDKHGQFYYVGTDRWGYGYWIGKYVSKTKCFKTEHDQLTLEDAQEAVKVGNNGHNLAYLAQAKQKFNNIVVFKEKYGERYFYVPTLHALYLACMKVFKERVEEGYWYNYEDAEVPVKPKIAKKDVDKYPSLKNSILGLWETYEVLLAGQKESLQEKKLYDAALKDEKGNIVLEFLESRKGSEYEGFEVICCEEL